MADLWDDHDNTQGGENAPEFSVSEVSGAVKRVIEGSFSRVRVRGEIGRISRPSSGHVYYNLKDDRSTLDAVTWRGMVSGLGTKPEEGLEVIATGRLTTFPSQSKYQLVVETLEPAGAGALMAMLEKRKALLAGEGLFDAGRKRPLPFLPAVIGVVTSPSGAVIRDILHRLRDRFPVRVLVWPVPVQGAACAPEVARAIRGFSALAPGDAIPRPDVVIVARGGGSIEDLWGFNEEIVVRAAADSAIPLISAVGHETDTTLIDFAADRRAPTPTAAAEMAVPMRRDLVTQVATAGARLAGAVARAATQRDQRLRDLARSLPRLDSLAAPARQRHDLWSGRLNGALRLMVRTKTGQMAQAAGGLRPSALSRALAQRREALAGLDRRAIQAATRLRAGRSEVTGRLSARLLPAFERAVQERRRHFTGWMQRHAGRSPVPALPVLRRGLETLASRLSAGFVAGQERRRSRLAASERLRQGLGYRQTLARGFAVVRAGDKVLTRRAAAASEPVIEIEFDDGRVNARPEGGDGDAGGPSGTGAPRRSGARKPAQAGEPRQARLL